MVVLKEKQFEILMRLSKSADVFMIKSAKTLTILSIFLFAINMFLTPEVIIKYVSPLFGKNTLWVIGGLVGVVAFMKSTWFMELVIRTLRSLFGAVLFSATFGLFGASILMWILDTLAHRGAEESILYHFMYVLDMYKSVLISDNSSFVLTGVLIFAILYNIADMSGIKYNNYDRENDSIGESDAEYNYIQSNLMYGDSICR